MYYILFAKSGEFYLNQLLKECLSKVKHGARFSHLYCYTTIIVITH